MYGQVNPELTGSIVGLQNGDGITASYSTVATAASPVADYAIVPAAVDASPAKLDNYTVTLVNGTLSVTKAPLTITADDKAAQYSDASPSLTVWYSGFVLGQDTTVLGGTLIIDTLRTTSSAAGTYAITPKGLTSSNYAIAFVAGKFMVTKEDALIEYTGDTLVSTGSTATSSMAALKVSAAVTEAADGALGSQLTATKVRFSAYKANDSTMLFTTSTPTCTAPVLIPATYAGKGTASCSIAGLGADNYVLKAEMLDNGYYTAPVENATATVVLAGTGFTTGGGWLTEPTLQTRSNLGFTVKYLNNGNIQGNSLYIYRKTLGLNEVANPAGGFLPAGGYNWIIKSNAMTGLTQKCPVGSTVGCTATFTGKSTISAVNRLTGVSYSLGGNNQFQVDVTDNGEPGSSSSTTPDTYALRVWDVAGTYYRLATPTTQLGLKGGNIQVRP